MPTQDEVNKDHCQSEADAIRAREKLADSILDRMDREAEKEFLRVSKELGYDKALREVEKNKFKTEVI